MQYEVMNMPEDWRLTQRVRCPECGAAAWVYYRSYNGGWMWTECDDGCEFSVRKLALPAEIPFEPIMPVEHDMYLWQVMRALDELGIIDSFDRKILKKAINDALAVE